MKVQGFSSVVVNHGFMFANTTGGMCISRVLKATEGTPQNLISPIVPNWVTTDIAV